VTKTEAPPALDETTVDIRGTTYRLRELTADQYDECLKFSTTGEGDDERVDNQALVRFMAERCIFEPADIKLTDIMALGLKSHRKLLRAVNSLHFGENEEQRYIRYLQSLVKGDYLSQAVFSIAPPAGFELGND
jgi:hypothetical protein